MSSLRVANIDELRAEATRTAVALGAVTAVVPHGAERPRVSSVPALPPEVGWSVLLDGGGRGIAINLGQLVPSKTTLTATVVRLRSAEAIARYLDQAEHRGFLMVQEDVPPSSWHCFAFELDEAPVWVALSGDWESFARGGETNSGSVSVRIAVCGVLAHHALIAADIVGVELELDLSGLRIELPERGLVGGISYVSGGDMKIDLTNRTEDEGVWAPGIRLDLGELEMRFEDLLALQPGGSIEVQVADSIRAYLRVGQSQLGVCELTIKERSIVLRVLEVF